jgi:uncharacterized membrane protein YfcA
MESLSLLLLGLLSGGVSGLVGIGGGVIIAPALVLLYGFSQHQAQGTTLALLVLPIGILAAYSYYKEGYIDYRVALLVAVGFLVGSLFGAKLAIGLPDTILRRVFAVMMAAVSIKMFL